EEEEVAKSDEEDKETGKGGDEVRESEGESEEEEETRQEEEESFDLIPRTPEDSEEESDDEEEQELRLSEEARIQEEEEANELYFDYMTQQMKEAVREAVQIQTDRLPDSLQRENDEFLCNINENMKKALVEAYEADKAILDTYGDSTILKRRREDDDQEGPSARSNRGSKRQKEEGEQASANTPSEKATEGAGGSTTGSQSRQMSASKSAFAEEPVQTTCQMEETPHPVFETGADDQPIVQTSQHLEWFSQPRKPPSPDRAWNTTLSAAQGDTQLWISELAKKTDARSSFNELLDTLIDFCMFIMNRLNVDTLTPDLLAGPTYELMRGSCTRLTELEYHLEGVYKATTDQLDWVNPEDLVPREMWIEQPIDYNKHA
nr:hypothetical protein [Tanacetum cinerariifolium]